MPGFKETSWVLKKRNTKAEGNCLLGGVRAAFFSQPRPRDLPLQRSICQRFSEQQDPCLICLPGLMAITSEDQSSPEMARSRERVSRPLMKSNNPRGCSKLALFWECCFCIHNEPQSGRPPFEVPMQSSEHAANVWLDGTGHSDTCPIDPLRSDEPQHHVVLSACLFLVAQHSTVKRECGRCLALAVQGGSSRAHAEHQTSKIVSSQVAFQN